MWFEIESDHNDIKWDAMVRVWVRMMANGEGWYVTSSSKDIYARAAIYYIWEVFRWPTIYQLLAINLRVNYKWHCSFVCVCVWSVKMVKNLQHTQIQFIITRLAIAKIYIFMRIYIQNITNTHLLCDLQEYPCF